MPAVASGSPTMIQRGWRCGTGSVTTRRTPPTPWPASLSTPWSASWPNSPRWRQATDPATGASPLVVQARETLRSEPRRDRALAHASVLAVFDWLPDLAADAAAVAPVLAIPEPEATRLLDELEAAGGLANARGRSSKWAFPVRPVQPSERRRPACGPPSFSR